MWWRRHNHRGALVEGVQSGICPRVCRRRGPESRCLCVERCHGGATAVPEQWISEVRAVVAPANPEHVSAALGYEVPATAKNVN